ncbi:Capsular polysaccharide biosynthesis protein [Geodermatophilus obscurus]|uniref:Capsular polysaccharide biosynthesis protein n=1 Tax=Geodermatophilus obscurus TaxID=1861 RepID=A0A1I5DHE1_9ACTN|nr:Capsular polysaccharide biosynthesis protein [Geodermatophilus obscurus]
MTAGHEEGYVELRDYARAVAGRWVGVVAAAAAGLLVGSTVGLLTPDAFESRVSLYVDAAVVAGPQDPSSAAAVRTTVLPSVAALATSSTVLTRVGAGLGLGESPSELADGLEVVVEEDVSVLRVTATRPTPAEASAVARAVGAEVVRRAATLFAGSDGPQLRVTPVRDATPPVAADRPTVLLAALGALAGAGAAGLAAGLAELARPRVRGRADVARVTGAPVLGLLPAAVPRHGRRSSARRPASLPQRAEEVARLRLALRSAVPARATATAPTTAPVTAPVTPSATDRAPRVALLGAATTTTELAAELVTTGPAVVAVDSPDQLLAAGPLDGVVVVADGRRTTLAELAASTSAADASGVPLAGVVVDGLLPPRAGLRTALRAAARGHATWRLDGRPGAAATVGAGHRASGATTGVAVLAVAMTGFTRPLPMGLVTGLVAAVALLPLWLPVVRRTRGPVPLLALAAVGVLSGALLAWAHSADHGFVLNGASVRTSTVLAAVGGVGVLLWARTVLPVPVLGVAFGLGMLATGLLGAPGTDNLWKFQLSAPLMVIALALAVRRGRPLPTLAVLGVLALLNVTNDARSAFGFCVVAGALVLWQQRPGRPGPAPGPRRWLVLPVLAALAAAGYWVLTRLMLAGALGAEIQERTAVQIAQTGSLILGGRPEWATTWALAQTHPLGFGLGIVPDSRDVLVGKAGIAVTNIPTAESYVQNYLLQGGVELHSILADLWADLGPAGVLLGLLMGALVVTGFAEQARRRTASGLVCLLLPMALWGLLFGPIASNTDTLVLALGLLLLPRRPAEDDDSPGAGPLPARRPLGAAA